MQPTATAPWAEGIRQIPATVIDNGVMRYVPYLSYKAGDYELNIYGDPDDPAGVEIGVYHELLKSPDAKANCLKFMADVLQNDKLRATLKALDLAKDAKEVDGITLEVTPETDPDAYGGWWVSAYSVSKLDKSRATEAELAQITVKRNAVAATPSTAAPPPGSLATVQGDPQAGTSQGWSADDMRYSRKPSAGSGTGGGSVYVRSYTRKDGTYVHSYTRSAPGHGGGGRR